MTKKLAMSGDNTTFGKVITATSNYYSAGKPVAQNNDLASCSECKGNFPLQGTAKGVISEGTLLVQDQDRVLCQCPDHRVLAGSSFYNG
ncbi:PAAR domain-containing protein [Erwinia sp. V90_4]|uniref:PAAR domain-containing protein n=1 Tax=Erwinia TaxID=551 RepID=UPI001E4819AC|nr:MULTISPECIES: PAAR domain-containing protein [Erwinia]MDI3439025.1 PAAR domain-containing protein [Erwinia sp. V90_4]